MPVNPAGLSDSKVWASLDQMAQDMIMLTQAMTEKVNPPNVYRENPSGHSMVDGLRDFTRMNPLNFTGSMTSEDPQEFVDEVHKILVAMGATDSNKA